tara:strand:- start:256 stop:459 length:204 start_codon:yes stop_codon:yes gene_type:complete
MGSTPCIHFNLILTLYILVYHSWKKYRERKKLELVNLSSIAIQTDVVESDTLEEKHKMMLELNEIKR